MPGHGFTVIMLACVLCLAAHAACAREVTVFAPSHAAVKAADDNSQITEIDVLIALMEPVSAQAEDMDRPQLFAVVRHAPDGEVTRLNLLGDLEEIRYLNRRAWGANVAVDRPGLYQLILEDKPRWNDAQDMYVRELAKVMVPVMDAPDSWDHPAQQTFEIVPLSRPYGLFAPALFQGMLLKDGKGLANVKVRAGNVSTPQIPFPTSWHQGNVASTDSEGRFSLLLNRPGWWFIASQVEGAELKGPDGELKPSVDSTVFWIYVDPLAQASAPR